MKLKKMEISDRVVQRLTEYLSILKEVRKYEDGINSIELSKIMDKEAAGDDDEIFDEEDDIDDDENEEDDIDDEDDDQS